MRNLLHLLLLLFPLVGLTQNFSGQIEYQIRIIPKSPQFNVDSLRSTKQGDIARYKITSNYYKSTYFKNNKETYSYTYDNISKRMYDEYVDKPYITFRDSRNANFDYKPGKIYKDSIVKILDMECFMVKYESNYGNSTTYYSNQVKVNYETFKDHQVGNWYNKLAQVDGCIAIKTITEFDDFYEIREAVKITPLNLSQEDFDVKTNKVIVASFSALDKKVEMNTPSKEEVDCYRQKIINGKSKKAFKEEPETCVLSFIINRNGDLLYLEPYDESNPELNLVAMDIIQNCGLSFIPGEIEGRQVSSLVYFPIEF
jgi:hypothetical protein